MDLSFTAEEEAFAQRGARLAGRARRGAAAVREHRRRGRVRAAVASRARGRPLGRRALATRVRRARRVAGAGRDLQHGVRALARVAADQPRRHQPRGSHAARARHRRAEGAVAARDPHGRRDLVPAVQRTRRRLRLGVAANARRARRRRLAALGPEGVDVVRAVCAVGDLPGPDRRRGPEAQGHLVSRRRHAGARHRDPPARADHGRRRVQRGVLRRGLRARRPAGRRAEQRLGGREHHARARTGHRVPVQGTSRARGVPRRAVAARGRASRPRRRRCRRRARAVVRRAARAAAAQLAHALAADEGRRTGPGVEHHQAGLDRHDPSAVGARARHRGARRAAVVGAPTTNPGGGFWQRQWLWSKAASIAGGTSEVQRTIIGDRMLGLPR